MERIPPVFFSVIGYFFCETKTEQKKPKFVLKEGRSTAARTLIRNLDQNIGGGCTDLLSGAFDLKDAGDNHPALLLRIFHRGF